MSVIENGMRVGRKGGGRQTFIYPVLLNGTIFGALPGPSLLLLSISLFQSSKYCSTFLSRPFTAVNPKSSQIYPVTNPRNASMTFLTPQGLKAGINSLLTFSTSVRKSTSETPAGSRISG